MGVRPRGSSDAFTTWRDKVEMGRPRSTYGRPEMHTEFWRGDLRIKDYLENLSVDGWIMLKWIFKKWDGGQGLYLCA
jgi:hypothetical protein